MGSRRSCYPVRVEFHRQVSPNEASYLVGNATDRSGLDRENRLYFDEYTGRLFSELWVDNSGHRRFRNHQCVAHVDHMLKQRRRRLR